MVQSARVQQLVIGDDVTLRHQIMDAIAYNAEISRAPVVVNTGDITKCFYPLEDESIDLIGYLATPVGSLPSSLLDVEIAGDIPAADPIPERGSKTFQIGLARTVRIEITRLNGEKETHYLYKELDVLERGFPVQIQPINLT
jgi:hypothetical protein